MWSRIYSAIGTVCLIVSGVLCIPVLAVAIVIWACAIAFKIVVRSDPDAQTSIDKGQ